MEIRTVSILGLGSEGSIAYSAARKFLPSESVRVIAKDERAERLKRDGITINGEHFNLNVCSPGSGDVRPDLLVVAVKGYQLSSVLDDIAREAGEITTVISLMNGLSSEDEIGELIGEEHVVYTITKVNGIRHGQTVTFSDAGDIIIGEKNGEITDRVKSLVTFFSPVADTKASSNIIFEIWKKFMINASGNTVSAIFRAPYKWFQNIREANEARTLIMEEIVKLANAEGIPLSEEDIADLQDLYDQYPPEGISSMAQDVIARRKTEADLFMGEALRRAGKHGLDLPVCRFVYALLLSIDEANRLGY